MIDVTASGKDSESAASPAKCLVAAAHAAAQRVAAAAQRANRPAGKESSPVEKAAANPGAGPLLIDDLVSIQSPKKRELESDDAVADSILREMANGYGLLFLGLGDTTARKSSAFTPAVEAIARKYDGPLAILIGSDLPTPKGREDLPKILVPVAGAGYSRFGAELAVAMARGSGASLTALHVSTPVFESELMRQPVASWHSSRDILQDVARLGERESIHVSTRKIKGAAKERLICEEARRGGYQLIVLGTNQKPSDNKLQFGESVTAILRDAPCPVLIVRS